MLPKAGYTERRVFILGETEAHSFTRSWDAGRFLLPWSYMDPAVASCALNGPRWRYERKKNGREAFAQVPQTVTLRTGELEYRDFHDECYGGEQAIEVKREHSRLEGTAYRVYNRAFLEANALEAMNRRTAYFLLLNATAGFDLGPIEAQVLAAVGEGGDQSIEAVAAVTGQSAIRVRAAALNLWRKGRVDLPMRDSLIDDTWTVKGLSDVER